MRLVLFLLLHYFSEIFSPLGHSQWKELILSTHLPLLRQGWLAHSSVLMWQNTPSYPEMWDKPVRYKHLAAWPFLFYPLLIKDLTWHTDAVEPSDLVQAGGIIMARIGHALIHIHLTARSLVSLETLTLEGAFSVKAAATMLTRVGA